jgi:hypothetical protein
MTSTRLPADYCPCCFRHLDAASGIDHDDTPTPSDVTVCMYCAAYLEFDENLRLKSIEHISGLPEDVQETLINARKAIFAHRFKKPI